jgi:hypothetical protein
LRKLAEIALYMSKEIRELKRKCTPPMQELLTTMQKQKEELTKEKLDAFGGAIKELRERMVAEVYPDGKA